MLQALKHSKNASDDFVQEKDLACVACHWAIRQLS
jgi:hypothetical protein